jgi:hypothetical protein
MKANQFLLAAMLASAIAVPTATLAEDKNVLQQVTRRAVRLPIERAAGRGRHGRQRS